jgi:hypothetical protein
VKVGDLVRMTNEGAVNIDEVGINTGSKGIIVEKVHHHENRKYECSLYSVVFFTNNRRIPYLYDYEIKKFE